MESQDLNLDLLNVYAHDFNHQTRCKKKEKQKSTTKIRNCQCFKFILVWIPLKANLTQVLDVCKLIWEVI